MCNFSRRGNSGVVCDFICCIFYDDTNTSSSFLSVSVIYTADCLTCCHFSDLSLDALVLPSVVSMTLTLLLVAHFRWRKLMNRGDVRIVHHGKLGLINFEVFNLNFVMVDINR